MNTLHCEDSSKYTENGIKFLEIFFISCIGMPQAEIVQRMFFNALWKVGMLLQGKGFLQHFEVAAHWSKKCDVMPV